MYLVWTDVFSHPLWAVSTVILGLILRSQRRGSWDPRACLVQLKGKTAIVTGANTGIGKFIALDFALRGARVIMACRSEARGSVALHEIRKRSGNADVHLRLVNTSSLASVRAFAEGVLREEKELHILVNNAGASGLPRDITSDGLEVSFATNHVGPFLLTNLLLGKIQPIPLIPHPAVRLELCVQLLQCYTGHGYRLIIQICSYTLLDKSVSQRVLPLSPSEIPLGFQVQCLSGFR
ncbi:unnamed protein product [Oncorhynchus mykiss]|uniref:Retinol dehydrogenase 12 n=1 Tax=Oncorhynchus mykiss TaxID=8022 RepID=A0A060YQV2_ONCMY|nr:unnamed protein product [Oncorhynchus mykiss]